MGQVQQDFAQGNIDQNYNDWYQKNYGYDQQRLNNYGNALNSVAGNFQGSSTSGTNPAYKPRTAGGAAAAVGGGALAGAATGATIGAAGGPIGAGAGALIGGGLAAMGYYL
jgi:phage tail tape-measure protein